MRKAKKKKTSEEKPVAINNTSVPKGSADDSVLQSTAGAGFSHPVRAYQYSMTGHTQQTVDRYCELAKKSKDTLAIKDLPEDPSGAPPAQPTRDSTAAKSSQDSSKPAESAACAET